MCRFAILRANRGEGVGELGGIPLPPRTEKPFYRSLAQSIRESIEAGRLKEGDSLPPQHEIARAARVNVGTVARAINLLIREQVLTKRNRRERVHVRARERPATRPPDVEQAAHGVIRLQVSVGTIETQGELARVHAVVADNQELVIRTMRAAVDWLELKAGQQVFVDISSPQVGLSSS